MARLVVISLALAVLAPLAQALEFENASVVGFVPDRVVITLKPGVDLSPSKSNGVVRVGVPALDRLADRFAVRAIAPLYAGVTGNLKRNEHVELLERVWTVDFSPSKASLESVLDAYRQVADIAEVRAVEICKMYDAFFPDDPGFRNGSQWHLRNLSFGSKSVRPIGAWAEILGDSNVVVASIDSGVDWHHPDLGGSHPDRVNGAVWTNWTEYYGTPGVDDDGNGYVDDIRGWDFVNLNSTNGTEQNPPQDVIGEDNDPMDYESHGTLVAGCMTAITNNTTGIAGLAPGCKVMAVRVGWLPDDTDGIGVVRMDFAAAGLVYAVDNGAKVLNCSWGSTSFLTAAVNQVQAAGGLIVTAAGNDDSEANPSYLSTRSGVIAVAATNGEDGKADFSNFGDWVELSAPGTNIYSTQYNRQSGTSTYGTAQGTSFASPIAAGCAALVWSAYPSINFRNVTDTLTTYADNIDDVNPGYEGKLGAGRVNLLNIFGDGFHKVPDEYVEAFDALQEAGEGETVALLGGQTYADGLRIHAKGLQVLGGYDSGFASRDPVGNPTIVQGDPTRPALDFEGGADNGTLVDGFRCENGGGKFLANIPQSGYYGGSVFLLSTSPTLRNLEITGGSVGTPNQFGGGGGMVLVNSTAVIENANIHGNTAVRGAGIYVYRGAPTLRDIQIADNLVIGDNVSYTSKGGGLYAYESDLTLENVDVENHSELAEGGGIFVGSGDGSGHLTYTGGRVAGNSAKDKGAGLCMTGGGDLALSDVVFESNTKLVTSTFMTGGGVYISGGTALLDGLDVLTCEANAGGGIYADAMTSLTVQNSVLAGNTVTFFGGALYVQNVTGGAVVNNTAVANSSPTTGGAGLYISGSALDLTNNISVFNAGAAGVANGVVFQTSTGLVACNDVFGNDGTAWGGIGDPTGSDGNIAADPLFCDLNNADYRIAEESPCAPANSGGCDLIGALAAGCEATPVEAEDQVPTAFRVEQNFPNPFNPQTTIRFALPQAGPTTVTIFDIAGRQVRTLLAADLPAAVHEVRWTGRDDRDRNVAAGVYFYRVVSGAHSFVGRMALVK